MTRFERNTGRLLLLWLTAFAAGGCQIQRSIPEGAYLLDKNTIKCDRAEFREGLYPIIKQQPNRKILGMFRFHLGVYSMADRGKSTKTKQWLKTAVGEAPVLVDNRLTETSREQLLQFMINSGHFDAVVQDTTIFRKKKARVSYSISSGPEYRYRSVRYLSSDTTLNPILIADSLKRGIKTGQNYSSTQLQKERDRLSNVLKNSGYFQFTPVYISFQVDSNMPGELVDIELAISRPVEVVREGMKRDSSPPVHRTSVFKEILIELDYDPLVVQDTAAKDTVEARGIQFVCSGKVEDRYHPQHLADHIFIHPGEIYNQDDVQLTYRRLSDLGIFRFVNIRLEPMNGIDSAGRTLLRCVINLSPQLRQGYQIESEATNNGGNFGIAGNLVYRNKNVFRGAESLNIKIKGGVEIQQNFGDTTYQSTRQLGIFNAYEIGPEISINFPRTLWPFRLRDPHRVSNPTTSITAGFNTQNRPEYFRQLANISYYYTQKTTRYNRFYFYPAEINYLNVELDPAFDKQLDDLQDPSIRLGYSDQFIADGRVSYLFNNQELNTRQEYVYFRINIEFAGNSLYLLNRLAGNKSSEDSPAKLLNVPFAQYFRPDIDLRWYKPVWKNDNLWVFRFATGMGLAYGNNKILPFEKSFFAGGPNEMRAWRTRQLGPGSNLKDDYFERFGEMKLTANVEWRFNLLRKLKAAWFCDAGNIWLIRESEGREDGLFRWNTFAEQVAVGTGLGLRLDLTFFIIRMDGAIRAVDPAMPLGNRWVLADQSLRDITFNFGIGYPF